MKKSHLLILAGFVAGIITFIWQASTIKELRTELTGLRKDVSLLSEAALNEPAVGSSEADRERREKLELIRLRNQVRQLNEGMVESHARERMANAQTILRSIIPTSPTTGPWKFRPEWKGREALATNGYAQAMNSLAAATNEYV